MSFPHFDTTIPLSLVRNKTIHEVINHTMNMLTTLPKLGLEKKKRKHFCETGLMRFFIISAK